MTITHSLKACNARGKSWVYKQDLISLLRNTTHQKMVSARCAQQIKYTTCHQNGVEMCTSTLEITKITGLAAATNEDVCYEWSMMAGCNAKYSLHIYSIKSSFPCSNLSFCPQANSSCFSSPDMMGNVSSCHHLESVHKLFFYISIFSRTELKLSVLKCSLQGPNKM